MPPVSPLLKLLKPLAVSTQRGLMDTRSPLSLGLRFGGGGAGAYAGAQTAEPPVGDEPSWVAPWGTRYSSEQLLRAGGGAALGGWALPGFARSLAVAKTGKAAMVNSLYYSYLSSPDTMIRANLGAGGGMLMHGLEQAAIGNVGEAVKVLRGGRESVPTWFNVMTGKSKEVHKLRRQVLGSEYKFEVGEEWRDIGLGKVYTAGDIAAVQAMRKSGMSTREALRYTLTGTPRTKWGKDVVDFQSRLLREGGYGARLFAGTVMPFARVGVLGIEQGLQRTPIAGYFGKSLTEGTSRGLQTARQAIGGGAMYGGYQAEEHMDPRLSQTLGTLTGPAFMPFAMGRGIHRALQRTGPEQNIPSAVVRGMGEGAMEFSPLGYSPMAFLGGPEAEIARRFVPSAVGDVAEAIDPAFGRVTDRASLRRRVQQGLAPPILQQPGVGVLASKIPGLREQLPVAYEPVGPEGRPRFPTRESMPGLLERVEGTALEAPARGLSRVLAPSRGLATPPVQNLRDPTEAALYGMGIERQAPSARGSLLGFEYDPSEAMASQMQLLRGLGPEVARQIITSTPVMSLIRQIMENNPVMGRWLAERLYRTVTTGVGTVTGPLSNIMGLSGARLPGGLGG